MAIELATLAIAIDSTEVKSGVTALDSLTAAGKRTEQSAKSVEAASRRTAVAIQQVGVSAGQQRAAMQQLGFQLGDVSQQFAMGIRPMTIFAQQGGQVVQALSLMTNSSKGLLGFLGGPWGAVLSAAGIVVGSLASKLLDTQAAMEAVSLASDGLSDAQGVMGKMFDTTTGKIKGQNDMLRLNAQLMAMNLRNEALSAEASAKAAANAAGQKSWGAIISGNVPLMRAWDSTMTPQRRLLEDLLAGRVSGSAAQSKAMGMDFSNTAIDKLKFMQAIVDATSASFKKMTAAEIDASLATGKLADVFIETGKKGSTAAKAHKSAIDELNDSLGQTNGLVQKYVASFTGDNLYKSLGINPDSDLKRLVEEADRKRLNIQESAKATAEYEKKAMEDGAQRVVDAAQSFADIIGGSLGSTINKILQLAQSVGSLLSSLGASSSGGIGGLLNSVGSLFGGGSAGGLGAISSSLGPLAIGAGVGTISDKILGAIGIKSSGTGAMVGGTIGSVLGPPGMIIGSIIGGILGGVLKKTKKGSSTLGLVDGALGITSTVGNSTSRRDASIAGAGAMIDSLNNIAAQLGGTANGTISTSYGMRNKNYVVDTTGQGRTKGAGVLSFKTEAEAVKAALGDAIKDGAITGLSAGANALLKKGGDIEAQLTKALAFEDVFKSLNPLGAAIDALNTKFASLKTIFDEAGATAADYAKLQQLQAQQIQAILDQASATYRSTFFSDSENIAFAKKTISATLTPLGLGSVDTVAEYRKLVDAQDLTTEAGQTLYATLMDLADEFGVVQDASQSAAAAAAEQAAKTAAEIADAKGVLATAYEREATALGSTIDKFTTFGATLRDFRDTLFAADGAAGSYQTALVKLMTTGSLAAAGDESALGNLPGVGKTFLQASKDNARSMLQYQRDVAMVARYVDGGIATADGKASVAQQQLDAMKTQVGSLIDLNANVVSVHDAIIALNNLIAQTTGASPTGSPASTPAARKTAEERAAAREKRLADMHAGIEAIAASNGKVARLLDRWDRGGSLAVATDDDTPLATTLA